jgi:putative sterol carrier protein
LTSDETRDATAEFFAELGERDDVLPGARATGTLRFDIVEGRRLEQWFVRIEKGSIDVSRGGAEADCVLRSSRELFARIALGDANLFAALLRGEVTIEGDPRLAVLFHRLFPGAFRDRAGTEGA